ncbi:hypothetical protein CEUSTIGMA_g1470.t1 [Chlamydomonas eustigma]|uniref:MI domain-containing protein n=1 Tax=Chlamydomonas eustigma TaxID=1157962 RepID=A0A250WTY9_9CHLO|nr:hypothetical protein CEUSTIGMA_g1470.t1 [Chlamydomonas eustigma]|eukprot:GAX74020.1 hypothetical protein CEUSTIGMA_g1470.t1 [Chlamydomonas eustigma]
MTDDEISLRPIVLKPIGLQGSGFNPFSSFAKGSGQVLKSKQSSKSTGTDDTKPKRDGERIKYSKDFLMQFMDVHTKSPAELQQQAQLNAEIIISGEAEKDQQRQALQKVVEEGDDRDWRTRNVDTSQNQASKDTANWEQDRDVSTVPIKERPKQVVEASSTAIMQQSQAVGGEKEESLKIVRASDVGLQAYRPGAVVSTEEKAIRQIKGILNKLTPEKFERLLQQLLGVITTADVLRTTIAIVFENAVEQPTYCAMYADLCWQLSKELPSFPPPPGSDKPLTFVQILLNTCQDEFEGAEDARAQLQNVVEPAHKEEAERSVKKRVMGTMRLISELYKKDMVRDWIITTCLESLLAKDKGRSAASEDSIEAACEMLSTAGGKVAKSESEKMKRKLEDVMKQLQTLEKEKSLSSRIRFVIKDVLDLRKSNWIPRRETYTAKKLDEVRAQAEAELGMVSSVLTSALPALPAQQRMGGPADDFSLIPPLRGVDSEAWSFPVFNGGSGGGSGSGGGALKFASGQSALLGDYRPPQSTPQPVASTTGPGAPSSTAAISNGVTLTEEELKRKTESLLQEYLSTLDKAEALACVRELSAPSFMSQLVETGLTMMMNCMKDKEVSALEELMLHMHAQGLITRDDVISGLATFTVQLEDISLDFPKATSILGNFAGSAVLQTIMALDALPQLLEGDYSVEPKREFAAAVFKRVKSQAGEDGLVEMCAKSEVHVATFLTADAMDGDVDSVEVFLKKESLTCIPL